MPSCSCSCPHLQLLLPHAVPASPPAVSCYRRPSQCAARPSPAPIPPAPPRRSPRWGSHQGGRRQTAASPAPHSAPAGPSCPACRTAAAAAAPHSLLAAALPAAPLCPPLASASAAAATPAAAAGRRPAAAPVPRPRRRQQRLPPWPAGGSDPARPAASGWPPQTCSPAPGGSGRAAAPTAVREGMSGGRGSRKGMSAGARRTHGDGGKRSASRRRLLGPPVH